MDRLLMATKNPGKRGEIAEALSSLPVRIVTLDDLHIVDEPEETGETCQANARLKARYFFDRAKIPTLADDTGLEVAYLNGGPGCHAARYAGAGATDQDRRTKLLLALSGVPEPQRTADFVCVIALVLNPGLVLEFVGRCPGRILTEARGAGGFGYDPIFAPDGESRSFAEMSIEAKRRLSHRGHALAQVRHYLEQQRG